MIRAYDEDLQKACQPWVDLADHIDGAVVAADPEAVRAAIVDYVFRHDPLPQVWSTLNAICSDPVLLRKARVVTDRNWCNCAIRVTPSGLKVTIGGVSNLDGEYLLDPSLRYWASQAETFFLELAVDEEPPLEERPMGESVEYVINWVFRKAFGTLWEPGSTEEEGM